MIQKKIIFLFLCSFLLLEVYSSDRPLRSIRPDAALPVPTRTSTFLFKPASNSLLTEKALSQQLTQHYIMQYSSPSGINMLNAVMQRGSLYMPFIREEVTKRGLPPELAFLPIIESGFQITARSRSGAMGLWQFMMNSISPYNMKVTDLIDERRDFVKSTLGALQKLEDEYKRLGCWELTLAAYNSGINAVLRTIQRTGKNDYWELSNRRDLRPETINFVPRLIAVSYVVSQPRRFGLNAWYENFEWDTIALVRQVSIDVIADETGLDRSLLRSLNAELLHGISPLDSNYVLKVPSSHFEQINEVLGREDLRLIRYHYHVVRQGDTLWSMSRHYGTSVGMIEQHNPGIGNRYLRLGETVIIPAFNNAVSPARSVVPQGTRDSHVVQRGETFWSISRRYGIDPQALAEANGMSLNQTLHAGRTLRVPIIE